LVAIVVDNGRIKTTKGEEPMESQSASVSPPAPKGRFGRGSGFIVAIVGLLGGGLIAGAAIANAATSPSPSPAAKQPGSANFDPTKGGHVGANGVVEKLLGTTADKAKAAALAAVPGGSVERVENDAEGAVYEAHMVKSDGTHVTVKMDASFRVTGIESDPARPAA
jgi:peptidase YpeB-like protein